ncbi:MAG: type IX secretion system sortase PorU [Chitinophagaceae bacterium]
MKAFRIFLLLVTLVPRSGMGQTQLLHEQISWSDSVYAISQGPLTGSYLKFHHAIFDLRRSLLPLFALSVPLNAPGWPDFQLENEVFVPLSSLQAQLYKNAQLGSQIHLVVRPGWRHSREFAFISLVPIIQNPQTGEVEKLQSFDLRLLPAGTIQHPGPPASLSLARVYRNSSVLGTGTWYKISVTQPGVYQITVPFLASLGVDTTDLSSSQIRLFGNGGQMLAESNDSSRYDDLQEDAIEVRDGGDGKLNGGDDILFYASGPDTWIKDSVSHGFLHQKNLYEDSSFYFLNFDALGKRISQAAAPAGPPNITVTHFNDRQFHEQNLVNFLNSGKQWFGEEFSDQPGKSLSRTFNFTLPHVETGSQVSVRIRVAARAGGTSRFDLLSGSLTMGTLNTAQVGVNYYDNYANTAEQTFHFPASGDQLPLTLNFTPGGPDGQGWLDFLEVNDRRNLSMQGQGQLLFRDWNSVGPGHIGSFVLDQTPANSQVWDITDPLNPQLETLAYSSSGTSFDADCSSLREYVAFAPAHFLQPVADGPIPNQDLHDGSPVNLLIVTSSSLLSQAKRLAAFHLAQNGLTSRVVTVDQIYNEFSSGSQDISAIRDFVKMYFDRAAGDPSKMPQYLLLFGAGSYDYKNRMEGNINLVPVYESPSSLSPLDTYVSDDFYGFLENQEDINNNNIVNLMDIGVGRLPASNLTQATEEVDKIIGYNTPNSFGSWRNEMTFVADDGDNNLHLNDAEAVAGILNANDPQFNEDKIYLDAYHKEFNTSGSLYPAVNDAINSRIFSGTLVWNYNGHGGPSRLSEADILDAGMVQGWTNIQKLPLFITATCDFSPYDNPAINSLGAQILNAPQGGGIALMTTTRVVFAYSNLIMNSNYFRKAFPGPGETAPTLGQAIEAAKNYTYNNFGDITNNRKFTLLGDPALSLAFPINRVTTDSLDGKLLGNRSDTLKALGKYVISGRVTDPSGHLLSHYNGIIYPTIYDKPTLEKTLGNDPTSQPQNFLLQNSILYKGKASVIQGAFRFTFVVPKDINYQTGEGKISYYTSDPSTDGTGYFNQILIGGTASNVVDNQQGPKIKAFLNDDNFVDGGITNATPLLLLQLEDPNGINTVGAGIGHDLVAILDQDNKKTFILNNYYEANLDSYQQGTVQFPLPQLAVGPHTLKIRAWDVFNHFSEVTISFVVVSSARLELRHVLNYPNPFTTSTTFMFEHNHPGESLQVNILIFTVSGKLVKTIQQTIFSLGNRSDEIKWNGRDNFGDQIARGVYIYELTVKDQQGQTATALQKLVLL